MYHLQGQLHLLVTAFGEGVACTSTSLLVREPPGGRAWCRSPVEPPT